VAVGIPGATPFGGHAGPTLCVAFSPDGKTFATGGEDRTARLWDTASRQQIAQFTGHFSGVSAVAYSPDGATLATVGDGTARVWNIVTGQQTAQFTGPVANVRAVAYSPDGTTLATGHGDGTARLWNASTGQQTAQLTGHTALVTAIAYSPDGTTLATADLDGTARLWNASTRQQTAQLTGHSLAVHAVAYSPDGGTLATAGGTVRLWDTATGQQTGQLAGHYGGVNAVAYSPHGTTLASASGDGTLRLWDTTGQQTALLTGHTAQVHAVTYSPDGTTLASASGDGTLRLWDTTGQQTALLTGHTSNVRAIAFSPDGTTLATAGTDRAVRLWDTATGQQTAQLSRHIGDVNGVSYSRDGTSLASASSDRTVRLWDTSTGQQTAQLTVPATWVSDVAYSPDGTSLATASWDPTVWLWDTATGQQTAQLTGHTAQVHAVAYSPDGTTLATASFDGTLRLWDTATGQQTALLAGHSNWVISVAYSPDGSTLASASHGGTVRLWDTATGQQIGQLARHTGAPHPGGTNSVAFSPDGSILATAGNDATVRLWDIATGRQRAELAGHTSSVTAVTYSPDGATLASVGEDGTIRIWNARNGAQINGTGFGLPRTPGRPLAGVCSDSPSDQDLLGVDSDVQTLAELIAATETRPPLAIALIGDWGTGKSSVMLQVERQINVLAERARNNPGLSAFAENVRQVRFNAWHYSDENLWAGLVSHLFEVLAAPPSQDGKDTADQGSLPAERSQLRAKLAAKRQASDKLTAELKAADRERQPSGVMSWLGSPVFVARVLRTAGRQALRDVRASLTALAVWAVLGVAAYAAWRFLGTQAGAVITAVAVAAPSLGLVGRKLGSAHRSVLAFANKQRADLAAGQRQAQRDIRSLEDQLMLIDAAARLEKFLGERGGSTAYREYQGLLGQVRADLERLAADLAQARSEWVASGGYSTPPLERIVLYIDDLDRCPPRRVVEVLEAVHLMLALDLFVVVVAVDARWLIRSLEYHHHRLFGGRKARRLSGDGEPVATPIDYLDKIFQIPYVLLPPDSSATARYLHALLPIPAARPAPSQDEASTEALSVPRETDDEPWDLADADGDFAVAPDPPAIAAPPAAADSRASGPRRGGESQFEVDPPDPRPLVSQPTDTPVVELRPQGLQLSAAEVEFMTRLGGLLPTPRAAKRLVNVYRLVRIGIPDGELAAFVGDEKGGPYQAVQVLLAILVGHPDAARQVFRALLQAPPGEDLAAVVDEAGARGEGTGPFGIRGIELGELLRQAALSVKAGECQRWCPTLARFSFYTRDLAGVTGPDAPAVR
jgi:WD40 repeat protein